MKFNLTIETGNDALSDPHTGNLELARILRDAAQRIEDGAISNVCRDINGGTVGHWRYES